MLAYLLVVRTMSRKVDIAGSECKKGQRFRDYILCMASTKGVVLMPLFRCVSCPSLFLLVVVSKRTEEIILHLISSGLILSLL